MSDPNQRSNLNPRAAPFIPRNPNPNPNIYTDPFVDLGNVINSITDRAQQLQTQQATNNQQLQQRLQAILQSIKDLRQSEKFQQLLAARQQLEQIQQQLQAAQQELEQVKQQLTTVTEERDNAIQEKKRLERLQQDIIDKIGLITADLTQKLDQYNGIVQQTDFNAILGEIEAAIAEMNTEVQRGGKKATRRRQRKNRRNKRKTLRGGYVYNENKTLSENSVTITSTASKTMRHRNKHRNKSRTN